MAALRTEFQSWADASGITHYVSDVILFVNSLEEVSLRTIGVDTHVITTVSLRGQWHCGRLAERIGSYLIIKDKK